MLQSLVSSAQQLLGDFRRAWKQGRAPTSGQRSALTKTPTTYAPLRKVLLTDGVVHTLFDEFGEHRRRDRGLDETGWLLLGLRKADEAIVMATLPAGVEYDAGVGHVWFNSSGQALGSRIVRQTDKRLTIVGVVHTHPGSLRHPSDGDFRGDSQWVRHLRGKEGVFGIGTADAPTDGGCVSWQPQPHVQCLGSLRFSWYALRQDDTQYRPIPMEITIGPDLALPLHPLWPALERHAERIDRLFRQQTSLTFDVQTSEHGSSLVVDVPLAEPGDAVRVLVRNKEVRYLVRQGGQLMEVDHSDERIDRGVYRVLAELASR